MLESMISSFEYIAYKSTGKLKVQSSLEKEILWINICTQNFEDLCLNIN